MANNNHSILAQRAPEQPSYPLLGPTKMAPQPVPTEYSVTAIAANDGKGYVVLQLVTPQGVSIYFFDEASAGRLEEAIAKTRLHARSGIILPVG